jgi:hypothetical protein
VSAVAGQCPAAGTPVEVRATADGVPERFQYRGGWHEVRALGEEWRDAAGWWAGAGPKAFFRLECRNGMVCELYRDLAGGGWFMYRVYD